MADAVPLAAIVREAAPFIIIALFVLVIISVFPDTILWLPRFMGYRDESSETSKRQKPSMLVMILNGPNLYMLGIREPHIYGSTTLDAP